MIVMKLVGSLVYRRKVNCCRKLLSGSRGGSVGVGAKML